jgi:heme-degrading monooxygenase HmoA
MEVIIRKYSGKGAKELLDALEQKAAEVESMLRSVDGFESYTLARAVDGGFSITVCRDRAGIDESNRKAKDWIATNAGNLGVNAPETLTGNVVVHAE